MRTVALSIALLLPACASGGHHEKGEKAEPAETEVTSADVPMSVRDAVSKAYPSASASEWSREVEEGVTYYEAALKIAGPPARSMDVLVRASDGAIVEEEERIEASALPAPVTKALAAAPYAGMPLRRAERIVKNGHRDAPLYEVLVGPKGHAWELVFDTSGKVVEKEDKGAGNGKEDGDEEG